MRSSALSVTSRTLPRGRPDADFQRRRVHPGSQVARQLRTEQHRRVGLERVQRARFDVFLDVLHHHGGDRASADCDSIDLNSGVNDVQFVGALPLSDR